MAISLRFLGAAQTVTGSKYLLNSKSGKILIDCGLFQGERIWRERNWTQPDFDLREIKACLITHAHIDHIGMIPRYFRLGLNCPIYCTNPTLKLSELLLPDSARLQEEEAEYRAKSGKSRHHPPLALYSEKEALEALKLFKVVPADKPVPILTGISAEWKRMGHIIGACSISLEVDNRKINFSGDIGRYNVPILQDPVPIALGDLLLIESTYADKLHASESPTILLAEYINRCAKRSGALLIPSFAVGRTQLILFYLRELKQQKLIPDIPVFIDSPMASDATLIYKENHEEYDTQLSTLLRSGIQPFSMSNMHFVRDRGESIALNSKVGPMIIISASGMLSGGRILHHLRHRISSPLNTILFVGHQPKGGRGDWIKSGAKSLKILGDEVPIRAEIGEISGLSAHADRGELLRWAQECKSKPGRVAVVHGEEDVSQKFALTLQKELGWNAFCPKYLQEIEI